MTLKKPATPFLRRHLLGLAGGALLALPAGRGRAATWESYRADRERRNREGPDVNNVLPEMDVEVGDWRVTSRSMSRVTLECPSVRVDWGVGVTGAPTTASLPSASMEITKETSGITCRVPQFAFGNDIRSSSDSENLDLRLVAGTRFQALGVFEGSTPTRVAGVFKDRNSLSAMLSAASRWALDVRMTGRLVYTVTGRLAGGTLALEIAEAELAARQAMQSRGFTSTGPATGGYGCFFTAASIQAGFAHYGQSLLDPLRHFRDTRLPYSSAGKAVLARYDGLRPCLAAMPPNFQVSGPGFLPRFGQTVAADELPAAIDFLSRELDRVEDRIATELSAVAPGR